MRQGKYHVKVIAGKQLLHAVFHPLLLSLASALRTMAVAAAMVYHAFLCTALMFALHQMPAQ
jgi:hypothetical protein